MKRKSMAGEFVSGDTRGNPTIKWMLMIGPLTEGTSGKPEGKGKIISKNI